MRLRVSQTMVKQLRELRDERGNVRRGGVMIVPRMLPIDEWEALASAQQDKLIAASAEDRAKPEPVVIPEPDNAAIQREHERLYQDYRKQAAEGGLPLVRANEQHLRGAVR